MQRTRAQIQSKIDLYLINNTSNLITPAQMNDLMVDVKDSIYFLGEPITLLGEGTADEVSANEIRTFIDTVNPVFTSDVIASIAGANAPSGANPLATMSDVSAPGLSSVLGVSRLMDATGTMLSPDGLSGTFTLKDNEIGLNNINATFGDVYILGVAGSSISIGFNNIGSTVMGQFFADASVLGLYHTSRVDFDAPIYRFTQSTASRVPYLDASKNLISSAITPTELGYLTGASSNLQAQISALIPGLSWKTAVRAASTGNISISAPITNVIDDVTMANGERILLKNQTDPTENGIYIWGSSLSRALDMDAGSEFPSATVAISEGTTQQDTQYVCNTDAPVTLGVTNISWVLVGGTSYVGTSNRIDVTGNVIDIAATYLGQSSITTLGTITTGVWNGTVIGVSKGGNGLSTIAAGSLIGYNSLDTATPITSTSGLKTLQNNAGTISWITTTGTGDNVYSTAPTFVTNITTPLVYGSSASSGQLLIESTSHATKGNITYNALQHLFQNSGTTRFTIGSAGQTTQTQAVTSGINTAIQTITGGAHTGVTAGADAIDVNYNLARSVQHATGAIVTQRSFVIQAATHTFVGSSTITNAATLAVTGAPIAGTNATITNAHALWVQSGQSQFDGNIQIGDAFNLILQTTTGTKIGTATGQKLGFWNATPTVQLTTAVGASAFAVNAGTAVNDASTYDGYTIAQVVKALRTMGILA